MQETFEEQSFDDETAIRHMIERHQQESRLYGLFESESCDMDLST